MLNSLTLTTLLLAVVVYVCKPPWPKIAFITLVIVCLLAISGLWDEMFSW